MYDEDRYISGLESKNMYIFNTSITLTQNSSLLQQDLFLNISEVIPRKISMSWIGSRVWTDTLA